LALSGGSASSRIWPVTWFRIICPDHFSPAIDADQ
jgi:hypothetical protein